MKRSLLIKKLFYHNFSIVLKHERFVCIYLFIMYITLTMSTGDAYFKGYIQTCKIMCVMSKICKCSIMNPPVSKEDSIFSWFSYWSWTQNKTGRWHFSKIFFIYIILYIYLKSFFKDILESNRNYEIKKLRVT